MLKTYNLHRMCRVLPSTINLLNVASLVLQTNVGYEDPHWMVTNTNKCTLQHVKQFHLGTVLQKYNKKPSAKEDEDSDEDEEFKDERDSKVLKTKVNSLRADLLVKAGLGIARNKIENYFYDSKIRVNGQKLPKKSIQLNVGDEIDVIRGISQANPSHIVVQRVVILDANGVEDGLSVTLRRFKSLLIENYPGQNAYKSSEASGQ